MNRSAMVLFAGALICVLCAASAQQSSTADAEQYIRQSESDWAETMASGDTSSEERILADDFIGIDPDGTAADKAKAISETRLGAKDYVSNHLRDVKIRFYGDTAVAQGSESWVRRTGSPLRGRFVWTDTWIRRNGKWQIVASEDLIVPEPSN